VRFEGVRSCYQPTSYHRVNEELAERLKKNESVFFKMREWSRASHRNFAYKQVEWWCGESSTEHHKHDY